MSKPLVKRPGRAGGGAEDHAPEPGSDREMDARGSVDLLERWSARYRTDEDGDGKRYAGADAGSHEPKGGSSGGGAGATDPRRAAHEEGDAHGRFAGSPTDLP